MKISKEKMSAAALVLLILMLPLIQTSRADTISYTAKDKMQAFLSEVIGLDLTKYNITNESYGFSYPSEYGRIAKLESVGLDLFANEGRISVWGMFLNGFIWHIKVDAQTKGPMILTHQPATNTLDELESILQRYQRFAQNYGIPAANITSALRLLDNITASMVDNLTDLTYFNPFTITMGDMKLEIVRYPPNLPSETVNHISFTWVYTENGVDMHNKCLSVGFYDNDVYLTDTWNLFTVGCFSVISKDEAAEIAFAAAKNYDLRLIGENGTFSVRPDWTNMTCTVILNMVPGQIHNTESKDPFWNPSNATREPLALYPLWLVRFYFSKFIGRVSGIAVSVWGDTKEIALITPMTERTDEKNFTDPMEISTLTAPSATPPPENPPINTYLISGVAAITIAIAVTVTAVALKKRNTKLEN